jgi:hypothetical protein
MEIQWDPQELEAILMDRIVAPSNIKPPAFSLSKNLVNTFDSLVDAILTILDYKDIKIQFTSEVRCATNTGP